MEEESEDIFYLVNDKLDYLLAEYYETEDDDSNDEEHTES